MQCVALSRARLLLMSQNSPFNLDLWFVVLIFVALIVGLIVLTFLAIARARKKKLQYAHTPPGRAVIFISYRRDDASDVAGRVYDLLIQHFGKQLVRGVEQSLAADGAIAYFSSTFSMLLGC